MVASTQDSKFYVGIEPCREHPETKEICKYVKECATKKLACSYFRNYISLNKSNIKKEIKYNKNGSERKVKSQKTKIIPTREIYKSIFPNG